MWCTCAHTQACRGIVVEVGSVVLEPPKCADTPRAPRRRLDGCGLGKLGHSMLFGGEKWHPFNCANRFKECRFWAPLQKSVWPTGGPSPQFGYATPPPPPCPPGPLSYQGSIATGHTYGGAKGRQGVFETGNRAEDKGFRTGGGSVKTRSEPPSPGFN